MLLNKKHSIGGNSPILNIAFIALNLLGLTFLVLGYHPSFEASAFLLKSIGYGLMGTTIALLIAFKGLIMFSYVSRVIVGGLFIVSGLIKANDPKGFAYKLEEYFEDGALAFRIKEWFSWETFSLEFFIQHALLISIILLIFEVVLGVLILLGVKPKASSWLLMLLMLFFTFLTWHTKECDPLATFADVDKYEIGSSGANFKVAEAEFNEDIEILEQNSKYVVIREIKRTQCVNDCGCFGDAMKGSIGRSLTPAESYWKDIILLYLGLFIFISRRRVGLNDSKENIVMIFSGVLFISFFSFIFSWAFPIFFGIFALILSLWIKRAGGKFLGNEWGMILMATLLTGIFTWYVLLFLPIKDYRPYHTGSNLIERMNDGVEGEYLNIMVYENKVTGKDTTLTELNESTKAIWGDTLNWKYSKRDMIVIRESILPSILQFNPSIDFQNITSVEKEFDPVRLFLEENQIPFIQILNKETGDLMDEMELDDFEYFGDDALDTSYQMVGDTIYKLDDMVSEVSVKEYILSQDQIILIIARNLETGNFSRIDKLIEIAENAKTHNIPVIMISTASKKGVEEFRERTGLIVPTFQNDDTEMKAITRSDPSLMVISNAVVKGKFPFRSTPSWKWLIENMLNIENTDNK